MLETRSAKFTCSSQEWSALVVWDSYVTAAVTASSLRFNSLQLIFSLFCRCHLVQDFVDFTDSFIPYQSGEILLSEGQIFY